MARAARRDNGSYHLRQRSDDKRWEAQTIVVDPVTGQAKRVSTYGKTRSEAKTKMDERLGRVRAGQPFTDSKISVSAWAEHWVATQLPARDDWSVNYREQRAALLKTHVIGTDFGMTRLSQLRVSLIRVWTVQLEQPRQVVLANGNVTMKPGLSSSSRRQVFLALSACLDAAVLDGLIGENPLKKIKAPKAQKPKMVHLETAEVVALLDALKDSPYYVAFVLAAATGARRGEVLGLTWSNVDLDAGLMKIEASMDAKGRLGPVKTAASNRRVALAEPVVELLRQHRAHQAKERNAAGDSWANDRNLVFTRADGSGAYVLGRTLLDHMKKALVQAGIDKPAVVHSLRHSAATRMLEDGIHIRAVADFIGHGDTSITGNMYAHCTDVVHRQAADALGAAFLPATGRGGDGGGTGGPGRRVEGSRTNSSPASFGD